MRERGFEVADVLRTDFALLSDADGRGGCVLAGLQIRAQGELSCLLRRSLCCPSTAVSPWDYDSIGAAEASRRRSLAAAQEAVGGLRSDHFIHAAAPAARGSPPEESRKTSPGAL